MSRRSFHFLAHTLAASLACAGPALEEIPSYSLGLDALSGHLWSVASTRFQTALATPELDDDVRRTLLLRLAESQVRGGDATAALATLADPLLDGSLETPFWTAQALATAGRLQQAVEALDQGALDPETPHRIEAMLTKAGLLRALGNSGDALATLSILLESEPDSVRARLLRAEIQLDQDEPEAALKTLPNPNSLDPGEAKRTIYLRARALLDSGRTDEAARLFGTLADPEARENQTLIRYHDAHLGLARARLMLGAASTAADGLLAFIQRNPSSPLLGAAFDLLRDCLPGDLAPNDPILSRLREWLPDNPPSAVGLLPSPGGDASGALPMGAPDPDPLAPQALYHLALALRGDDSADSKTEARRLLTRLRLEFPNHPLVPGALLQAGRWDLEDGRRDQAAALFDALRRHAGEITDDLRARALILEATALFKEKEFEQAAELFEQAAASLSAGRRVSARLNAATSLLAGGKVAGFNELAAAAEDPALTSNLALERALYAAASRQPGALADLREFIAVHPDHPRLAEARLSAALAALDAVPPDLDLASVQLATIGDSDRANLPAHALALAEIRMLDRTGDRAAAALRADEFLKTHPQDPHRAPILFEKGRALFQNKDYNDALLVLEKLAADHPDSPQAPAAMLLAASAAAEGGTSQSQRQSIEIFDRLIGEYPPFSDVARLEKAELLLRLSDLDSLDQAIETLGPWFDQMADDAPLLYSAGLLLGDALYARAGDESEPLTRALDVYDRLLAALPADSPARYRILYQKGLALERLGLPESESKALETYMDVIQAAASSPASDWKSIELCGFSALKILEKRGQWQAAKQLAHRIAGLNGPRAAEAEARAKALGLQHMLWEAD